MTMSRKRQPRSLRARVVTAVLLCWILPVLGVMALAGYLLGSSYERASRRELETRMTEEAEALRFEEAGQLRDLIADIRSVQQRQDG